MSGCQRKRSGKRRRSRAMAKRGEQYWAKSGAVVRAEKPGRFIRPGRRHAEACCALGCMRSLVGGVGAFGMNQYMVGVA